MKRLQNDLNSHDPNNTHNGNAELAFDDIFMRNDSRLNFLLARKISLENQENGFCHPFLFIL